MSSGRRADGAPKHGDVIVCAITACLRARLRTAPIRSRERQRADAQLLMTFCLATRKSDGCVSANDPAFHSPHPEPWDMRNPGSYSVQTEAPKSQRSGVAVQVKNRTHTPLPGEADRLGEIVNKEHGFGNAERSPVGGVGLEEIPEETGFPPGAFHQPESENQQVSRTPRTAILKPRAVFFEERIARRYVRS
jgi:hypothetical protein